MDLKLEELSEEVFEMNIKEISDLIGPHPHEQPSPGLKESIMDKVKGDVILKDSADFVVDGFGKGLQGIFDTVVCLGKRDDGKTKRTY